jgi:hypothetical protein
VGVWTQQLHKQQIKIISYSILTPVLILIILTFNLRNNNINLCRIPTTQVEASVLHMVENLRAP